MVKTSTQDHALQVVSDSTGVQLRDGMTLVGSLTWHKLPSGRVIADSIYVEPNYRRHGMATRLWQEAKLFHPNIEHSDHLSEDGLEWSVSTF